MQESETQNVNQVTAESSNSGPVDGGDSSSVLGDLPPVQAQTKTISWKKQKQQQKRLEKQIKGYQEKFKAQKRRLATQMDILKSSIKKEDWDLLTQICTANVPEQKNEEGAVTQAAQTYVNKQALMTEAKHLIALNREQRILSGLRKRSSGRVSKRTSHKRTMSFLAQRNAEIEAEEAAPAQEPSAEPAV